MVGAEGGEFVFPGFVAGFPHHPGPVQKFPAVGVEFTRAVRAALLVHPPAQGVVLGHADCGLGVVRHGVQAGDLVVGSRPDQGLVALESYEGFGPYDAAADEGGDVGGAAGEAKLTTMGVTRSISCCAWLVSSGMSPFSGPGAGVGRTCMRRRSAPRGRAREASWSTMRSECERRAWRMGCGLSGTNSRSPSGSWRG